jgi:hypothetical protein
MPWKRKTLDSLSRRGGGANEFQDIFPIGINTLRKRGIDRGAAVGQRHD